MGIPILRFFTSGAKDDDNQSRHKKESGDDDENNHIRMDGNRYSSMENQSKEAFF
jgi:hypothetical protein